METEYLLRAVFSLIIVAALIGIAAFLFQRFAIDKNILKQGKPRRLKVEEFAYIDGKRKLALVRMDNKEFLLLLSPHGETVITTNPLDSAPEQNQPEAIQKKPRRKLLGR